MPHDSDYGPNTSLREAKAGFFHALGGKKKGGRVSKRVLEEFLAKKAKRRGAGGKGEE